MIKLYFGTKKLTILAVLATTVFAGCGPIPGWGGPYPPARYLWWQHDHALFFTGSTPPDTAIFCGVESALETDPLVEYTLYISATASRSAGTFRMTFRDGTSRVFNVAAGMTYSDTHMLGGPVKITPEGGVRSMMASVQVLYTGFRDPFDETLDRAPTRLNNFCVTAPREPGSTSAARIIP